MPLIEFRHCNSFLTEIPINPYPYVTGTGVMKEWNKCAQNCCNYVVTSLFRPQHDDIWFAFVLIILHQKSRKTPFRSSHQKCSIKKGLFKNFRKFIEQHLCQSPFLRMLQGSAWNYIKKRLWHKCFPLNFVNSLRTPF